MHILAVDDEPLLLRTLVLSLTGRGYLVTTAQTGGAAISQAAISRPDLMILDLGLPDVDGLEVIRHVRQLQPDLPIVVLSARTGSPDKVAALDLGAIDYVTKPFDMSELDARIRASLRRTTLGADARIVQLGPLTVDLPGQLVRDEQGRLVHLTRTEWTMLKVLLSRPGSLVTAAELLVAMRGSPEHTESSYLRIYLQQLRRKLEPDPTRPRYLITEPGMGYRYVP